MSDLDSKFRQKDSGGRGLSKNDYSDAAKNQLAKYRGPYRGLKACFLGTSITNRANAAAGRGYVDVVQHIIGTDLISLMYQKGVPGNTTAQMLARYDADVRANNPDILFLECGTNDVMNNVPLESWSASVEAIVTKAKEDGLLIICATVPPFRAAESTTTVISLINQYNIWLRIFCARNGIPVAGVYEALTTQSGSALGGYMYDAVHPNTIGHFLMARAFAAAFATLGISSPHIVTSETPDNLCTNPIFASNTTGWYEQPGGTGSAITYSREAASGKVSYGQWHTASWDAVSGGTRYRCFSIPVTAGQTYLITARLDYEVTAGNYVTGAYGAAPTNNFKFEIRNQSFTSIVVLGDNSVDPPGTVMGVFTAPSGTTGFILTMRMTLASGMNVKFKIGEVGVYNVTGGAIQTLMQN